jgi:hypothetical protein
MSDAVSTNTLGRQVGVTDQYLRVWQLVLFQQQGYAAAMGYALPPTPPAYSDPTTKTPVPRVQFASYAVVTDHSVFSSEHPTGQSPGIETYAAGLRIHFTITKAVAQTPNTAQITIYNLSKNTVSTLIREYNYCILQVGYEYGQVGTIFMGTIKMYKTGHENVTDTYLTLYAADGEQGMNLGTMNHTYPPGTDPSQQVDDMYQSMHAYGVFPGAVDPGAIAIPQNARSDVKYGMTSDHLRDFSQANGAIWYILDQQFHWARPSSYAEGTIVKLNAATGLIGYPEMTQDGINITALINPAIRLMQRIQLDNAQFNQYWTPGGQSGATYATYSGDMNPQVYLPVAADGIDAAASLNYEGDSRGQPWYMYMTCLAVDSTAPVDQITKIILSMVGGADWSPI